MIELKSNMSIGENIHILNERVQCKEKHSDSIKEKRDLVPLCNACANPGTVMIMHWDAAVADVAVEHPGCFHYIAGLTVIAFYA